jgi:elongation factor P hydroxylase
MKARIYLIILLFITASGYCQEVVTDTIDNDTIAMRFEMEEVVITNYKDSISPELKKKLAILRRRVLKVYPYAKIAAERLTLLNQKHGKA